MVLSHLRENNICKVLQISSIFVKLEWRGELSALERGFTEESSPQPKFYKFLHYSLLKVKGTSENAFR